MADPHLLSMLTSGQKRTHLNSRIVLFDSVKQRLFCKLFLNALFVVYILICNVLTMQAQPESGVREQHLNEGWMFSAANDMHFYPATVPGNIHTDLLRNQLIPHPFEACNEKQLQWIGEQNWVYRTTFQVSPEMSESKHIALIFDGLDTYAEVLLNGHSILKANNMFRRWEAECKTLLKPDSNQLEIVFHSAIEHYKKDSANYPVFLPGGKWVHARKAAYHFGWDWGPTYITAGIWKPVRLLAWNSLRAHHWHVSTINFNENEANIRLEVEMESDRNTSGEIRVLNPETGQIIHSQAVEIHKGAFNIQTTFRISQPQLWWSNGLGKPHLYDWLVKIITTEGSVVSTKIRHGIRSLRLIKEQDSLGSSFYFELNGKPVFAKGANYIPQHMFVNEVTDSSYRNLINQAVSSNINMLRVWGGGIYERDLFYELCNEHGIMVWQDFMFACAMYPGDSAFLENVKQEAAEQVKRLRNHPSLALWCGNNEVDEAWHNWGWQQQYAMQPSRQDSIWTYYEDLFHRLLPKIVEQYHPEAGYISSSPQLGWGRAESMTSGDSHYWGVWWGKEPFEKYLEKVPRFMSEFGFQALPSRYIMEKFGMNSGDSLMVQSMKCHQKHPMGYETIDLYLAREALKPQQLNEYIYLSQLIQAKGIGLGIEAQRSAMPRCMGSLYWQLNDVWPVTSWSGIDHEGVWKALQYRVKELFAPLSISIFQEGDSLRISVINENPYAVEGSLLFERFRFDGVEIPIKSMKLRLNENQINSFSMLATAACPTDEQGSSLLRVRFRNEQGIVAEDAEFLKPLGMLSLSNAPLELQVKPGKDGLQIQLKSDAFIAFVSLSLDDEKAHFSDNFFHLYPGETKNIMVQTSMSTEELKARLRVLQLNELIQSRQKP